MAAGAATTRVGTGYVEIEPDFSRFQEVLGQRLNKALAPAFRKAGHTASRDLARGVDGGGLNQALRPLLRRFEKFGDEAGRTLARRIGKGVKPASNDMFGLADAISEVERRARKARKGTAPLAGDMFGIGQAARRSGRDLRSLSGELRDVAASIRAGAGGFGGFDGVIARVNRNFQFFRNIMRTLRWPALLTGVGLAAQGLSALAAAAGAAAASLGPLAGALVVLPAAALTAAQAFGVLKLATAGVGGAVKAALDAEVGGGTQAIDVLRQQQDASERVADAKRNLVSVQKQARIAQEDLTQAREDARRELEDMRLASDASRDSEEQAVLSLKEARRDLARTLADPAATGLDVRFAEEAVDQAQHDLERTRLEAKRARQDYRDAQKAGVSGMPQVVAAERAKEDAKRAVEDAERDLARAVRESNDLLREQGAAAETLHEKMSQLPPAAQAFVRVLVGLKPRLDDLRETAAAGFFPGATKGLRGVLGNFGRVRTLVGETSAALGRFAARAGRRLGSAEWGRDLLRIGRLNTRAMDRLGEATLNLADAFRHVLSAARPFLDWLSTGTLRLSEWVKTEAAAGRQSGRLAAFFDRARKSMELLGPILKGVGGSLLNIGEAARPLGNQILFALGQAAEGWRRWTGSVEGQNSLRDYFASAKPAIFEMGRLLRDATKAFFELGTQPGAAKLIRQVRTELLPALTELIGTLTGAFGQAFVVALTNVVRLLGELAHANGPLVAFVRTIGFLSGAFADLLRQNPALQTMVTGVVAFGAALKTAALLGAVTGFSRLSRAILATAAASRALASGSVLSAVASQHGIAAALAARVGQSAAGSLALSFGRALGPALGALGLGNIVMAATQGDWKKVGIEAGAALAAGLAGVLAGGPVGALIGVGAGSLLGGALSGLFDSSKDLAPVQERIKNLSQHAAQAMRKQAQAADGLAAAQRRLRGANNRHKAASEAVAEAQRKHTAAVRKFGPDSLPALKAALQLARAQRREAKAAEEAEKAHKLSGIELELFKTRTTRAYAAERKRIPVLDEMVDRLTKRWRSEKSNLPLQERLEKKVRELSKAEGNRDRLLREAAQRVNPRWARSLERMSHGVAKFVSESGRIKTTLTQLPRATKAPQQLESSWGDFVRFFRQAARNVKGEAKSQLEVEAGRYIRTFQRQGAGAFGSLAAEAFRANQNMLGNTRRASAALGSAKIPNFQLKRPDTLRRQEGGPVPTKLADGGLASVVPGNLTGDRHTLSLNGVPVAKVESREGIFVGNRNLMGALQAANAAVPRFQTGGALGGLATGAASLARNLLDRFGGYISSGLRPGDDGFHGRGMAVDWVGGDWAGAARYMNSIGSSLLEGIYTGALGGPPVSWDAGQQVPSSFWGSATWGAHGDHIHGAAGGPVRAAARRIARLLLSGPNVPLRHYGQSAIDHVWKAANAFLRRQIGVHHRFQTPDGVLGKAQIKALWKSMNPGLGDPNLMAAIAMAESGGNPAVTNSIGARGLYQIIPSTAAAFGLNYSKLVDAAYNTLGAGRILRGQGLSAWEAYTNGAYTQYLQRGGMLRRGPSTMRLFSESKDPNGSNGAGGKRAEKETTPAVYRGARTKELNLPAIPRNLEAVEKEIQRWQRELRTYLSAKQHAEKHGKSGIAKAIGKNVGRIETHLGALREVRSRLRLNKAKKGLKRGIGKRLGRFAGYEQMIEEAERHYNMGAQGAEQIVALEPQSPELPANATDAQREAAEKDYVARYTEYIEQRERPAYTSLLERVADWRNKILRAETFGFGEDRPSVAAVQTRWEGRVRQVGHALEHTEEFSKKVAERVREWRSKHPKAKELPTWLRKQLTERDRLREALPRLRFEDKELRAAVGKAREMFFPGGKNRISPPPIPLPGTGSLEEKLEQVQGLHWPGMHELLPASALATPRVAGRFGGVIWDLQGTIEELGLKIRQASNNLGGSIGGDGAGDEERSAMLEQLLREANQRTAVSEILARVRKQFEGTYPVGQLPPFGGIAHTGAIVPGPKGAERTMIVQSGEAILTPEQMEALGGGVAVASEAPIEITFYEGERKVEAKRGDRELEAKIKSIVRSMPALGRVTPGGSRF